MKNPPKLRGRTDPVFDRLGQSPHKERLSDYLALLKPLDDQGRYLPFDALRYRWAPGLDSNLCWALVKKARTAQYSSLLPLGDPVRWLQFVLTPLAQKAISAVDRQTTTAMLEYMTSQIASVRTSAICSMT